MKYYWLTLITALSALLVWGGCGLTRHIIVAVDRWGSVAPAPTSIASIIAKADVAVGNLADATGDWGDASKAQTRDVRVTLYEANRLLSDFRVVAKKSGDAVDAMHTATDAGTTMLNQTTEVLNAGKATVDALPPLLNAYTQTGLDLDTIIKDTATPLHTTLAHVAGMSASSDAMLVDAQWKAHQLLHPDKVKLGFWGSTGAGAWYVVQKLKPSIF